MASSPFRIGVAVRAAALFLTIGAVAWMMANTQWYVTIALFAAAALAQIVTLVRFSTQSSREVARFLDALSVDDLSQSFIRLTADEAHRELGTAMERVLARLRASRSERDEQAQYLQTLVNHVPVALVSMAVLEVTVRVLGVHLRGRRAAALEPVATVPAGALA